MLRLRILLMFLRFLGWHCEVPQEEELMKWAKEENVTEDIMEGLKELTAMTTMKLKCANMIASVLAKDLPEKTISLKSTCQLDNVKS